MTTSPFFADRIRNITVTGSLVRIEFGVASLPTQADSKPELVAGTTLVLPLDGLVASMGMLEAILKKLVADGMLEVQAPATATSPDPGAEKADMPQRRSATK
jgi:hypothetical protein